MNLKPHVRETADSVFLSFTQSMSEYFKLCRKEERESSTFKRFQLDCKVTKQKAIIFPKALYKTLHVSMPSQGITFTLHRFCLTQSITLPLMVASTMGDLRAAIKQLILSPATSYRAC